MRSAAEIAAAAMEHPALAEATREEVVQALFLRDRERLPDPVLAALQRGPQVVLQAEKLLEVAKVLKVANRAESTTSLGLPVGEYHALRTAVDVDQDMRVPVSVRPRVDIGTEAVIPQQGGIQVDVTALDKVRINPRERTVTAYCGASCKTLLDGVRKAGYVLPLFPSIPLDFSVHDVLAGPGTLRSPRLSPADAIRTMDVALPTGDRVDTGRKRVSPVPVGYAFHGFLAAAGRNTGIPLAVDFDLLPKTKAYGTFRVWAEDGDVGATLQAVLDTDVPALRVDAYDGRTASVLRGPEAPPAVEVTLAGSPAVVKASKEILVERFQKPPGKMDTVAGLFEVRREHFLKTADRLLRNLIVGQAAVPAADLKAYLDTLGERTRPGLPWGYFAALAANGTVLVAPHFEESRDRNRILTMTQALVGAAEDVGASVLGSQLAPLLAADKRAGARHRFLARVRSSLDLAGVLEPDDVVKGF